MSLKSMEKVSLNALHNSLKAFCCTSVTSASCNSTFLCTSMSAGDVINFFSLFSELIFPSVLGVPLYHHPPPTKWVRVL